ncbi:hypothetical protein OIU34_24825 [Pararhizobium sp. BT-229]|uniref:hypothetical protein n=1 Tax=Pararhizobium sp. BT-229 TaxID=2986923 RepID=UPI0021F743D4|nr:hypothetical protein [Pararhizobium sp. BT-229]MCV9965110.1 hypothetical protein [Pararhizobium sp. BT-229]
MRRTILALVLFSVPTIAVAGDPFGQWSIKVRCSYGSGSYLFNIDENGRFKGSINGRITAGSISGGSVQFTTSNFLNSVSFSGTISPDGNSMSGQYSQSTWSAPCTWAASKVVAYRQEPRTSDNEYRKDAAEAIQIAKEMAKRCTYADQMAAADQLQRAASAYRSIGDQRRLTQVNAAITKITKDGGTADQCRQKSTSSRNKVASSPKSNKGSTSAQCKKANDWALQLIRSHPDQTKFAKDSVEQLGCKPAFSAMPTSCKLKDQIRWQRQGFTEAQIAREKRRLKCSG